jgi:hypothetical protein
MNEAVCALCGTLLPDNLPAVADHSILDHGIWSTLDAVRHLIDPHVPLSGACGSRHPRFGHQVCHLLPGHGDRCVWMPGGEPAAVWDRA